MVEIVCVSKFDPATPRHVDETIGEVGGACVVLPAWPLAARNIVTIAVEFA
jgi:hypothetical protein